MMNAVTGWDFTNQEAAEVAYRISHLLRAFNIRHGVGPELEVPSPRYGSAPVDGPCAGKSIMPDWEQMLDVYYQKMGWDRKSGKPLPQTLIESDLEYVIADLWQ
jgi:aldehyde:ferredoxin oxidoreductase